MLEGRQLENINSSLEVAENVSLKKKSVSAQSNRLFGRQKSVHQLLGSGKSADVLLWRNKKISGSVLSGATVVWILFEWLNYHFLSFMCLALALGMLAQFLRSNVSGLLNKSPSHVPPLVLPLEMFVNIGKTINGALVFIQNAACRKTLKEFLSVIGSLMAAAIIGSRCSFLTILYVGFIAAHTLPVLYEKYDHKIDNFVHKLVGHLQKSYKKLDIKLLSRIPKGRFRGRKFD